MRPHLGQTFVSLLVEPSFVPGCSTEGVGFLESVLLEYGILIILRLVMDRR